MKSESLILVGDGEFAEIAYEYFTHDSPYEVAGFAVEQAYRKKDEMFGLPVVDLETIEQRFPPDKHSAYTAITYTQLNRVRTRLYGIVKAKGYRCATYVSSHAFVWRNAEVGENCFIFEANVVQYRAKIGNNVVLWSGNHIGHRAEVGDNTFMSSHVVVSGYSKIGESCFVGVNSTIGDNVTIARDCVIGAGSVVLKDVPEREVMRGNPAASSGISSFRIFRVRES